MEGSRSQIGDPGGLRRLRAGLQIAGYGLLLITVLQFRQGDWFVSSGIGALAVVHGSLKLGGARANGSAWWRAYGCLGAVLVILVVMRGFVGPQPVLLGIWLITVTTAAVCYGFAVLQEIDRAALDISIVARTRIRRLLVAVAVTAPLAALTLTAVTAAVPLPADELKAGLGTATLPPGVASWWESATFWLWSIRLLAVLVGLWWMQSGVQRRLDREIAAAQPAR